MSLKTFFLVVGLILFGLMAALYQPTQPVQHGYRGTGMVLLYKPDVIARQAALNKFPTPLRAAKTDGPLAKDAYQNVRRPDPGADGPPDAFDQELGCSRCRLQLLP
jgi:hypothetical protein